MNLKWSYSSSKGFYIGFKVTVVIDYDSMKPVAILIHSRAPNDSKLSMKYWKIFKKDKIYKKDVIFFDKGYYSYKNYQNGISKYKIVPFIFPKDNFNKTKLDEQLSYPLHVFNKINKINIEKRLYHHLKL